MPETLTYPRYSLPLSLIGRIILSLITGKPRNFQKDARRACAGICPLPVFYGMENIPSGGPFLATLNHYSRPGFMIIWAAFAISTCLPHNPIWLMTRAWTKRAGGWDTLQTNLTEILFKRLAQIYGFVTMPAMPPHSDEVMERAVSIRQLMGALRLHPDAILCLAPEGMDFPDGKLGEPHAGSGKLIMQLQKNLQQILPVGVYEKEGSLMIIFGKPYLLGEVNFSTDEDATVTRGVMKQIAALLPEKMRGIYGR